MLGADCSSSMNLSQFQSQSRFQPLNKHMAHLIRLLYLSEGGLRHLGKIYAHKRLKISYYALRTAADHLTIVLHRVWERRLYVLVWISSRRSSDSGRKLCYHPSPQTQTDCYVYNEIRAFCEDTQCLWYDFPPEMIWSHLPLLSLGFGDYFVLLSVRAPNLVLPLNTIPPLLLGWAVF